MYALPYPYFLIPNQKPNPYNPCPHIPYPHRQTKYKTTLIALLESKWREPKTFERHTHS